MQNCPSCKSTSIYQDRDLWICAECFYEWNELQKEESLENSDALIIKDANGNILADGDAVTVIKELKIKGSSSVVKVGTKVKNIRLIQSDDGHNIGCRIDGIGAINLKSEFVRIVK